MAVRRRRWTEAENAILRRVALRNAAFGLTDERGTYQSRLRNVARMLGRTYAAVRIQASRIRAISYEARAQIDLDKLANQRRMDE